MAGFDRQLQTAADPGDERGAGAPVGRQRRDRHAVRTRRQDRSAAGHRVGARAQRRGHHEPITGDPGVEHAVHADGDQHLPRSVTDHCEVVDGDRAVHLVPADIESRYADGRPAAGGDLLERPRQAVGGHRHQHADAPAGHAEHRSRARGAGVQRREGGPVPSEGQEQVAGRGLDRVRHPSRLSGDGYLADGHAMRGRPRADLRERHLETAGRMDDQADPAEGVQGLVHCPHHRRPPRGPAAPRRSGQTTRSKMPRP